MNQVTNTVTVEKETNSMDQTISVVKLRMLINLTTQKLVLLRNDVVILSMDNYKADDILSNMNSFLCERDESQNVQNDAEYLYKTLTAHFLENENTRNATMVKVTSTSTTQAGNDTVTVSSVHTVSTDQAPLVVIRKHINNDIPYGSPLFVRDRSNIFNNIDVTEYRAFQHKSPEITMAYVACLHDSLYNIKDLLTYQQ